MKLTTRHVTGSDVTRIVAGKDQSNSRYVCKQHQVQRLGLGYGAPLPCAIYKGNIWKQGTVDKLNNLVNHFPLNWAYFTNF